MRLIINGEPREVEDGIDDLGKLIMELGLENRRIAIELNRVIIKKDRYTSTNLADGDNLEILQFVGGG